MDALSVRELSKVYKGGVKALDGVSFSVGESDFYALLGPNGAGKSTTIGIIAGLVKKTSGTVSVFGRDLDRSTMAAKSLIGLVPQDFDFSQFDRVFDVVVNQAGLYGMRRALARQRAEQILKRLWEKRDAETRELSGGMKRRLLIARALAHNPKLLILDEPTAGVDINVRRATWDLLRLINRSGTAIILTTHYLEEAENLCRSVGIINHGRIVTGGSGAPRRDARGHKDHGALSRTLEGTQLGLCGARLHGREDHRHEEPPQPTREPLHAPHGRRGEEQRSR